MEKELRGGSKVEIKFKLLRFARQSFIIFLLTPPNLILTKIIDQCSNIYFSFS